MAKLPHSSRLTIAIACGTVFLLSAVALAFHVETNNQQAPAAQRSPQHEGILRAIRESPDQPLSIVGNDDCPLRITSATVKEISGSLFTGLTGRVTDLETISSYPEVSLVNTSGHRITRFAIVLRDPRTQTSDILLHGSGSVAPGEAYMVRRELFVQPERRVELGADGQARPRQIRPGVDSEKSWIRFAARSDLFISIGLVEFENGDSWRLREGGEVR